MTAKLLQKHIQQIGIPLGLSPQGLAGAMVGGGDEDTPVLEAPPLEPPSGPMDEDESEDGRGSETERAATVLAVMSNGTATSHQSNAFEGALDGLDFTMGPFGMDSAGWDATPWPQPEFGAPGLSMMLEPQDPGS
jgi:hypothetical protein